MTIQQGWALTDPRLRPGAELLDAGRALARDWRLGPAPFLAQAGVASEAAYKRRAAAEGRIMQHAHIGFRNIERTIWAISEVHQACARQGVTVDRFGITLDWSMGYPPGMRAGAAGAGGFHPHHPCRPGRGAFRRFHDRAAGRGGESLRGAGGGGHFLWQSRAVFHLPAALLGR
jgi:hypothetical protein